jgi:hypothetical protein
MISERKQRTPIDPSRQDTVQSDTQGCWPLSDKHLRPPDATTTTETDSSSKGSRVELTERTKVATERV